MAEDEYPEYREPDNTQLANFMVVYASKIVDLGGMNLDLNPAIIERLLESNPIYRMAGLRHHRRFYDEQNALWKKMQRGQVQCAHIRANDRRCPNWNQPGSFYCGLHIEEESDAGPDEGAE